MILGYLDLIATKRGQVNALPINNIAALVKFDLNMTEVASTAVDNTLLSIAAVSYSSLLCNFVTKQPEILGRSKPNNPSRKSD